MLNPRIVVDAPHAVLINDGLRFPVRNGATTRYLSEPGVATAYRNRFASAQRQGQRIVEVEREAISRIAIDDNYAWVIVSLVPDLPGDMIVQDAFKAWEMEIRRRPTITNEGVGINRTRVGRRRLLADGTSNYAAESRFVVGADPAEAAAAVDDLAQPGPALIEAAALLLDELGQAFGVPEMGQLTRDGRIRRGYWNSIRQSEIVQWA
ncbi:hypothetical protein OG767_10085 [Micromonospora sp. NBC_01392]|uniref:hypothetical protein n=1 Tax=Micromonospora sp. NBC_01392 TaxID=2903588 RepID=UPI0032438BDD